MKDSFFILLRYFLRVDNKKAQVHDTRIYHEVTIWYVPKIFPQLFLNCQVGKSYMLKEVTAREIDLSTHNFEVEVLNDPVRLAPLLPLIKETHEKLLFPSFEVWFHFNKKINLYRNS